MSLTSALNGLRNTIISQVSGFTTNNCSIGDEVVFNYIQTTTGAPTKCIVLDYGGFEVQPRTEFRSVTVEWQILLNAFFMIPSTGDIATPLSDARTFLDALMVMLAHYPTLNGTVLSAKPAIGDDFIDYKRGNFNYVLVMVGVSVLDNIS